MHAWRLSPARAVGDRHPAQLYLRYVDVKKDMYRITPLAFANLFDAQEAGAKAEQEAIA